MFVKFHIIPNGAPLSFTIFLTGRSQFHFTSDEGGVSNTELPFIIYTNIYRSEDEAVRHPMSNIVDKTVEFQPETLSYYKLNGVSHVSEPRQRRLRKDRNEALASLSITNLEYLPIVL